MDTLILSEAREPSPEITSLLEAHFALMRSTSPAESCHVMAPEDVFAQADVVLCARESSRLLGIGALKLLSDTQAELKSMHTIAEARGKGVGKRLLGALVDRAREAGVTLICLETGSADEFAAARALYVANGFSECPPFGEYVLDPLSTFMSREI